MRLSFVLPDLPAHEGGQACALALIASLREAGHEVTTGGGVDAVEVIDGYLLPRLAERDFTGAVGLIHHPTALAHPDERASLRAIEAARLPRLARVIATSEATARRLREEFGVPGERLRVVSPGLPILPRTQPRGEGTCRLLSVGALVPRKGHDRLIAALARLFDLDWSLTIAGSEARDPAYAAALRGLIDAKGLGARIRFDVAADPVTLEGYWRACDLYALFSSGETWPATIAEALRRGLPVAATGVTGLVPPEAGATGRHDDVDGMSKFLRRMIFDGALRVRMGEAAWRAGLGLPDWPTQARRFVEAIA